MTALYRTIDRRSSPIEPALRSLIQVRIAQDNACDFCVDLNSALGMERGVSEERFRALAQFANGVEFSEREKAALEFAEIVTRGERRVDKQIIAKLRQHFDDQAIVELAALIAYQNMSSKFNAALGVEAHGFCAIPPLPGR